MSHADQLWDEALHTANLIDSVITAIVNKVPYQKLTPEQQKIYLDFNAFILVEVVKRIY